MSEGKKAGSVKYNKSTKMICMLRKKHSGSIVMLYCLSHWMPISALMLVISSLSGDMTLLWLCFNPQHRFDVITHRCVRM